MWTGTQIPWFPGTRKERPSGFGTGNPPGPGLKPRKQAWATLFSLYVPFHQGYEARRHSFNSRLCDSLAGDLGRSPCLQESQYVYKEL